MIKYIILAIFFFTIGFFTHALYFPDMFANGIVDIQKVALPNSVPTQPAGSNSAFETKITYKDGKFNRHNITLKVGTYLIITNTSTNHLMELIATDKALATPRGYGESEAIRQRMETRGQFAVADKNSPTEKLVITVK